MPGYLRLFPAHDGPETPPAALEEIAAELLAARQVENDALPAGYTYLAQFLIHDLTMAVPPHGGPSRRVEDLRNGRTRQLDLDSLYGAGPVQHPHLYEAGDPARLAIGVNDVGEPDLPRVCTGAVEPSRHHTRRWRQAVVPDPRDDLTILVSQVHLAFARFHNRVVTEVRATSPSLRGPEVFEAARLETVRHYQWLVVNDLCPHLCGARVDEILPPDAPPQIRFFTSSLQHGIPVEFAFAAGRVGHAMVRPRYALNDSLRSGFGTPEFEPFSTVGDSRDDSTSNLIGGRTLPQHWSVQWDRFVGATAQRAMRFGPAIARPLARLPLPQDPPGSNARLAGRSLPLVTLHAGAALGLPRGHAVARALGIAPSAPDAPLWPFLLAEAQAGGGRTLGPCAATIFLEVIGGLLVADPQSILNHRTWRPTLGSGGRFAFADLLRAAGMPFAARDLVP